MLQKQIRPKKKEVRLKQWTRMLMLTQYAKVASGAPIESYGSMACSPRLSGH